MIRYNWHHKLGLIGKEKWHVLNTAYESAHLSHCSG